MTPIDSYQDDSLKSQENKIFVDFSYENQNNFEKNDAKNDVDMK